MDKRWWLWGAFLLVHALVATLGYVEPNSPMGDVYIVYEPWSMAYLGDAGAREYWGIPGITTEWVYPAWAIVPMLGVNLFSWAVGYTWGWAVLVTVLDAIAFAVLIGRGRSNKRNTAAVFWLVFMVLIGPVGMYRLDGLTVPIALLGVMFIVSRPWFAGTILAIATWIKIWPAAIIAAGFVVLKRRLVLLYTALIVSATTIILVVAAGGAEHVLGFVSGQSGRGIQAESVVSSWYMWLAIFGVRSARPYYSNDMLTYQVGGPGSELVSDLLTPLMAVAVLLICALAWWRLRKGAASLSLFVPLMLALVTTLIVFNKVGSPQFMVWLVVPVVIALVLYGWKSRWWFPAASLLAIALLTHLIYPLNYGYYLGLYPLAVMTLTIRNILLVVVLVWAVAEIWRVPVRKKPLMLRNAPV